MRKKRGQEQGYGIVRRGWLWGLGLMGLWAAWGCTTATTQTKKDEERTNQASNHADLRGSKGHPTGMQGTSGGKPDAGGKEVGAKRDPFSPQRTEETEPHPSQKEPPFLHSILLNGGAEPQLNFYSHVLYLRMMRERLIEKGMKDDEISILSSDGDAKTPDQLILDGRSHPGEFLFAGRPESHFYARQPRLINTTLEGKRLLPARLRDVRSFFWKLPRLLSSAEAPKKKKPLFLFVTDHGTRNPNDPSHRNNQISLWGDHLTVQAYHALLRPLREQKIVSVMSQCFSGSFAWAIYPKPGVFEPPDGRSCGFYAATPERPAYGCFADTRLGRSVGHAYRFLLAMKKAKTFDEAHRYVVLHDRTPDVPIRSSDHYLRTLLITLAAQNGKRPYDLADRLLESLAKSPPTEENKKEALLIRDLARQFGLVPPSSMSSLVDQAKRLEARRVWLEKVEGMWKETFAAARNLHLRLWYKNHPAIEQAVQRRLFRRMASLPPSVATIPASFPLCCPTCASRTAEYPLGRGVPEHPSDKDRLKRALYEGFQQHVSQQASLLTRLQRLQKKEKEAHEAVFWIEIQKSALLRMEYLLFRAAGRHLLASSKSPSLAPYHEGLKRLLACEETSLGNASGLPTIPESLSPPPLPQMPSLLGLSFRPVSPSPSPSSSLPSGAVMIRSVYLQTPAAKAQLQPGDILLATDGEPLREPFELRERVMLAPPERPLLLRLRRGEKILELPLHLAPQDAPPLLQMPPLLGQPLSSWSSAKPWPPETTLPPLSNQPLLLFFWATWCGPCKAAFPTLERWQKDFASKNLRILGVASDTPAVLQAWLEKPPPVLPPFPHATDHEGLFAAQLQIQATPTFVLLKQGKVVHVQIGAQNLDAIETLLKGL